jgi:hypothetical protein
MPPPAGTPAASTYDTKPNLTLTTNFPPIVDLMGVHPMSVRLLGVCLMGIYLMGVYL